jgi:hypothetical protein
MASLLWLLACGAGTVTVPPAKAGDGDVSAPIDAWLAGSSWACEAKSSLGPTLYTVEHSWSFTETTFTSDLGDRLAEAANTGYLPQYVAQSFMTWISQDTSNLQWSSRNDLTDRHWFGGTDRSILMEFTVGTNDGTPERVTIDRYDGSDGSERAEFSIPAGSAYYIIDCTPG